MTVDWSDEQTPIALTPRMDRDADGKPVLAFRRIVTQAATPHVVDYITEPDGPVRHAMIQSSTGCGANLQDLRDGTFVMETRGPGQHRGVIGGTIDKLDPKVLGRWQDGQARGWACGSKWIARIDSDYSLYISPWDMSSERLVTAPSLDPDGINATQPLVVGDHFFFSTARLAIDGVNVWSSNVGTRPLMRWPGDYTKGAADLGTDGIDMVWTYGEGKASSEAIYPIRSIMTSRFAPEPATLQPRRLRSSPFKGVGTYPWVVGCGYAANAATKNDILVVRLTDGVSWLLPAVAKRLHLHRPLGITCDEIFALGEIGGQWRIARVKLESLGPGTTPD